jgi:hypothetical protein
VAYSQGVASCCRIIPLSSVPLAVNLSRLFAGFLRLGMTAVRVGFAPHIGRMRVLICCQNEVLIALIRIRLEMGSGLV